VDKRLFPGSAIKLTEIEQKFEVVLANFQMIAVSGLKVRLCIAQNAHLA